MATLLLFVWSAPHGRTQISRSEPRLCGPLQMGQKRGEVNWRRALRIRGERSFRRRQLDPQHDLFRDLLEVRRHRRPGGGREILEWHCFSGLRKSDGDRAQPSVVPIEADKWFRRPGGLALSMSTTTVAEARSGLYGWAADACVLLRISPDDSASIALTAPASAAIRSRPFSERKHKPPETPFVCFRRRTDGCARSRKHRRRRDGATPLRHRGKGSTAGLPPSSGALHRATPRRRHAPRPGPRERPR